MGAAAGDRTPGRTACCRNTGRALRLRPRGRYLQYDPPANADAPGRDRSGAVDRRYRILRTAAFSLFRRSAGPGRRPRGLGYLVARSAHAQQRSRRPGKAVRDPDRTLEPGRPRHGAAPFHFHRVGLAGELAFGKPAPGSDRAPLAAVEAAATEQVGLAS